VALVDRRIDERRVVRRAVTAHEDPVAGMRYSAVGALNHVHHQLETVRFYLTLSAQPRRDVAVAAHAARLNRASATRFARRTAPFARLSLHFAR